MSMLGNDSASFEQEEDQDTGDLSPGVDEDALDDDDLDTDRVSDPGDLG